jgi:hypothetical protein
MSDAATRSLRGWREIHRYAYLQRPYEDVRSWLAGHLSAIGAPLPDGGRSIQLRIRPGGVELSRPIRLHLAGPVDGQTGARHGLGWVDAAHPRLFPELDGVVELASVPNRKRTFTQVGVVARYRPPFGALGAVGDRLAGAEVADAALTAFVEDLVDAAESDLGPSALLPAPDGESEPSQPEEGGARRIFLVIDALAVRTGGAVGASACLMATPGVIAVSVDPWSGLAAVDYEPERCSPRQLVDALQDQAATGPVP